MNNEPLPDFDWDDEDEPRGDDTCPNCGEPYDEIDYEYQICHYCKFNNNKPSSNE